ncbi:MAG: lysophospholipase [Anaerolineales bacterium]
MVHSEGTLKGADGLLLYQQSWKPGEKTKANMAVVHGLGEHSGRYGNVVEAFVPRGYAVWGFDLRGHGRTPGPRGHIDSWGQIREDVRAFLNMVLESDPGAPLILYGHSLGGLAALEFVLHEDPGIKCLIASAPSLDASGISPIKVVLAKMMSRVAPGLTMDTDLEVAAISRQAEVVEAYVNDPLVHGKASARMGAESIAAMDWTWEHAAELSIPLLVIQGDADRLVSPEAVAGFFGRLTAPDKTLLQYPGGYHEPHNDLDKERAFEDIRLWLEARL